LGAKVLGSIKDQFLLIGEAGLVRSIESLEEDEPKLEVTGWINVNGPCVTDFVKLPIEVSRDIRKCLVHQENRTNEECEYFYFRTASMIKNVLYIRTDEGLDEEMRKSLAVYLQNIAPLFLSENESEGSLLKSGSPERTPFTLE